LHSNGYVTAAVVSHKFVDKKWNFHQGFDFFDQQNVVGHGGVCSQGVTKEAIRFLRTRNRDKPFFLFVHYFDPHFNYVQHDGHRFPTETHYSGPLGDRIRHQEIREMKEFTAADLDKTLTVYDSEIAYTDYHIGNLFDALAMEDSFDDTLIVLTADHGEEFHDHGSFGHARTLYNEVIHVPLLIKYPEMTRGRTETKPVALIDVFPTVLDYLQIPLGHRISGKSLRGEEQGRPVFSETSRFFNRRSAVADGHKLIWDKETDSVELYDLQEDPRERSNLAKKRPEIARAMKSALMKWDRTGQMQEAGEVDLSDDEIRELKALGYLE
jgi:arylsulfatase A-like enzyme